MLDGWICLDKESGMSSNFAMVLVRRLLKEKTGYVGTLDPFATGVLPIAVGRARHFISYLDDAIKNYIFTIKFGATTDSLDRTGEVLNTTDIIPTLHEIENLLPKFIGKSKQIPPQFSAIKINGKRACDLMRSGKNVELASRDIEIFDIKMLSENLIEKQSVTIEVECSKGTYVRSLARDIAENLGSLGYVEDLNRTKCGFFSLKSSITIAKLREIKDTMELESVLIPIDAPLGDIPALSLESDKITALLQGRSVSVDKFEHEKFRLLDDNRKFYGVCGYIDGVIKPLKMYIN